MNQKPPVLAGEDQTVTQHLIDEIERRVSVYETQAQEINGQYLAQIEKLAKQTTDPVLAQFFRDTVRPGCIASAISTIRFYLRMKQIVEAKMALDRLGRNLEFVEQHLIRPILDRGRKFSGGHGPRRDALTRLIDEALAQLGRKASANAVRDRIRAASNVEIDTDGTILWRDARGKERTTTFKTFQNRLAERRRLFPQPRKKI